MHDDRVSCMMGKPGGMDNMQGMTMVSNLNEPRSGSLPGAYPVELVEVVTLQDGAAVTLRPIRPDDAPLLRTGFQYLSAESIFFRFLEAYKELPERLAIRLSNVDYLRNMAIVAEIDQESGSRLIGVARYGWIESMEPGLAECGIIVADDYQGRGLGTLLMDRLTSYARQHHVRYFLANVHSSNTRIIDFIEKTGLPYAKLMVEPGLWEIRIALNPAGE